MIQYALSIVAAESVRLYVAITDGVLILVDKFFEMQRGEAVPALEIYRKAVNQAQKLSDFFEMCRSLEFGQTQKYVKIEQNNDDECVTPKLVAILDTKEGSFEEGSHSSDDCEETTKSNEVAQPLIIPDLLSWDEPSEEASESMAATEQESSNSTVDSREATGWELALPTTPTSHAPPLSLCMGGVVNRSVLDSLYETAVTKPSGNGGVSHTRKTSSNPFEADEYVYNENIFYSGYNHMLYYPSLVAHQSFMQVAETYQHPAPFMHHQDQSMVVYDYMQIAGVPHQQPQSAEQNYQQHYLQIAGIHQQQQESWAHASDVSSKHMFETPPTEVMVQQQGKPVAGHRSTVSFGNPFE